VIGLTVNLRFYTDMYMKKVGTSSNIMPRGTHTTTRSTTNRSLLGCCYAVCKRPPLAAMALSPYTKRPPLAAMAILFDYLALSLLSTSASAGYMLSGINLFALLSFHFAYSSIRHVKKSSCKFRFH
jgi:hypothetical protein